MIRTTAKSWALATVAGTWILNASVLMMPIVALAQSHAGKPQLSVPPAKRVAPAQSVEAPQDEGDAVARAGSSFIKEQDVRTYLKQMGPNERAALVRDPQVLSQIVRGMLGNDLVLKEAQAKKWDQRPDVGAQLERLKQTALVEIYLRSVTTPPDSYPSNADVESAYATNKAAFLVPRQFHLAQIVVHVAEGAANSEDAKARTKLEGIKKGLSAAGADFGTIASRDSEDGDTAGRGGDLGWLPENQLKPAIRTQVIGLAVNAISEPVRLDDGWHIFKLLDTKAAYTRSLDEVRAALVQRLRDERAAANCRAYIAGLFEHAPPAINELGLATILDGTIGKTSSK